MHNRRSFAQDDKFLNTCQKWPKSNSMLLIYLSLLIQDIKNLKWTFYFVAFNAHFPSDKVNDGNYCLLKQDNTSQLVGQL